MSPQSLPALTNTGQAGTVDSPQHTLEKKLAQVKARLTGFGRVLVAFSGGVDSTLLVKLAREVLGRANVLAVTAHSPSLAQTDFEEACRLAKQLDVEHLVIETLEVENPAYRANSSVRCYFCKQELFDKLIHIAQARGIRTILYGAIGDDLHEERPGTRAASDYGVRAPLQEESLSKWEVREAARWLGLPNWDQPQNACLSSRIPHGVEVTEAKLKQIERAETMLRGLGFRQIRVRHLGPHARIEVGREELNRFQDPALCGSVAAKFHALGFRSVGVDRAGYRPGGADDHATDELLLTTSVESDKLEIKK